MRQRIDAFPRAGEIQMPCHGPWRDDAADASGHGGAEAIEGVFENDGFIGCDTEIFGGMEEEAGVGLHLAGVIDGGNMMKMIFLWQNCKGIVSRDIRPLLFSSNSI